MLRKRSPDRLGTFSRFGRHLFFASPPLFLSPALPCSRKSEPPRLWSKHRLPSLRRAKFKLTAEPDDPFSQANGSKKLWPLGIASNACPAAALNVKSSRNPIGTAKSARATSPPYESGEKKPLCSAETSYSIRRHTFPADIHDANRARCLQQ
jgi:hypothetical protein